MKRFFSFIRHHYQDIYKAFLFILTGVVLLVIFPQTGMFKYEFFKGTPWLHEDLYAPFDFAINKTSEEINAERETIRQSIKPYFIFQDEVFKNAKTKLEAEFDKKWPLLDEKVSSKERLRIRNLRAADQVLGEVFYTGIIKSEVALEGMNGTDAIILIRNNVAQESFFGSLLTIQTSREFIYERLQNHNNIESNFLAGLILEVLDYNVFYDDAKTQTELESLLSGISLTHGLTQTGEKIISRGDIVSNDKYKVLQSLKDSYESKVGTSGKLYMILIGQIILIMMTMGVLALFLVFFRKDIYSDNKKIVLILLMLIFMVLIASVVIKYNPDFIYIIPICLVPIVIRAFFDTRLALFVSLITVIIIGFMVPISFEFVFLQVITVIVAILSVVNLQRRSQFFLTAIWIFLTYSLIYIGLSLIQEGSIEGIMPLYFGLFAGSAVLTLFSYLLIYILERIFGFITDVTLIELSNTNNKLLRELSLKAPGTFQHSLQVANLAEEAIYAVGGNAMLVRAGALYHDIGKMDMPSYFIENQTTGINPHDELTYEESAKIIIDHVIGGIERAKKHKLPEQLIDFIRTHHGTRRVEYFYIMKMRDDPNEKVDEKEFTYPGPIPFSKETAVLMMADSVEAASRSLKEYDEEVIDNLVENIISKQVETLQFENSDITFKEITRIKKILKIRLMNIYHIRIEYPR